MRTDKLSHEMCRLIGRHIRDSRLEAGWTERELAQRANIGKGTLHRLESGEHNPTIDTIVRVYGAFGHRLFIANYDPTQPRLPQIVAALNAPNPNEQN